MFSIVMPLYNKAPYVRHAIESVIAQSDGDWELIVVDNSSTDEGFSVVEKMAEVDNRIRLFQQSNRGASAARNLAAAKAHGDYLCFLDADDWWDVRYLEAMRGLIERHPDAGIYSATYYIVKNGRTRVAPIGIPSDFIEGPLDYCSVYAQTLCMPTNCSVACVPRQLFLSIGGFREQLTLGEDLELWLRITDKYPFILLNRPLSYYNQDANPQYRAIKRMHDPKHHVLWNLDLWEEREKTDDNYKRLVDGLRTYGLYPYYLSRRYREAARQELSKVDWHRQPRQWRSRYRMPLTLLLIRERLINTASYLKRQLIQRSE